MAFLRSRSVSTFQRNLLHSSWRYSSTLMMAAGSYETSVLLQHYQEYSTVHSHILHEGIHPPWWWQQVPMKHRYSHSITKNTVLFTVTTMKASDLTYSSLFINSNARRTFFIRQLALFFAQTVSLFQFAVGFTKNVLEFILGFCSAYLKVMEMYFLRLAHRRRIILLVHGTYIEVL